MTTIVFWQFGFFPPSTLPRKMHFFSSFVIGTIKWHTKSPPLQIISIADIHSTRPVAERSRLVDRRPTGQYKHKTHGRIRTPLSVNCLEHWSRYWAAWCQMAGWWFNTKIHCSVANMTRRVTNAVSSLRSGFDFSKLMYFFQMSTCSSNDRENKTRRIRGQSENLCSFETKRAGWSLESNLSRFLFRQCRRNGR